MEILINTIVFLALGYASYYILSKMFAYQEGLTSKNDSEQRDVKLGTKAKALAAELGAVATSKHDAFIFGTYRSDYEHVILNAADLVEALMLETTLSIDAADPMTGIDKLVKLNQAKLALNSVLTHLDKK
jgi:hypothetical protein